MNFDLTSEQEEIRRSVRGLMRGFPDSYWMGIEENHRFPGEFYNAFAAAGYLGMVIPEEYGGSGLGITEAGLMLYEVAASNQDATVRDGDN